MAGKDISKEYRKLPSVNALLQEESVQDLLKEGCARFLLIDSIHDVLEKKRTAIKKKHEAAERIIVPEISEIAAEVAQSAKKKQRRFLNPVINATGVILHTNLGRAVLPKRAVEAIQRAAGAYTNLEIDLDTGKRGLRYQNVESLLCKLTGAEAALVVNNNAAAVFLSLATLGKGKEAIVSRGQLVEIGGSFRIPDVMEQSGVKLVEVGTTNKTHVQDIQNAIGPETGLLVRVHTSNYRVVGFTEEVELKEMVELGCQYQIPVLDDLGSGCLLDLTEHGMEEEPLVQNSVKAGADLVTFSGDKLFGGPQAGIILGKRKYIERIKKNPLLRAFRIDKLTLSGLEAVLVLYLEDEEWEKTLPVYQMLFRSYEDTKKAADSLAHGLREVWLQQDVVETQQATSRPGGGSLPETEIMSEVVVLKARNLSAGELERSLREHVPPILCRVSRDFVIIDPRTLIEGDKEEIIRAFELMENGQ